VLDLGRPSAVRVTAVYRLTDQSLLAQIAQNDPDADVRSTAVWLINDRSLLARIAEDDVHPSVRQAAWIKFGLQEEDCGKTQSCTIGASP
jgi:hypothetical protein